MMVCVNVCKFVNISKRCRVGPRTGGNCENLDKTRECPNKGHLSYHFYISEDDSLSTVGKMAGPNSVLFLKVPLY